MTGETTGETRVVYDGRIVRLELLGGKWEVVRHADAVAVLALNTRGEMLLVRQERRAVGAFTVEAPAGLIDPGETPEQAARRELQEEAGLDGDVTLITRFYASPGFCDEFLHVFEATNLRESRLPHDEDEEGIEVLWLPPAQVLAGLRDGSLVGSASTVAAAMHAVILLAGRPGGRVKTYVSPGQRPDTATVVAVGSFDGVHLGHQALIAQLKAKAREHRVPSVVYTFDPPTRVLTQGVEFLSTLPEKLDLLARYGVDETIAASFTPEFASRPKEAFLDDLRLLRPRAIVVGEDFHFGRGRAGSAADLREVAPEVVVVPIHGLSGEDIKSTRVREYLKSGDVDGARRLLGRHYDAQGVVVQGDQLGRTIGWPTANISVPDGKALPLGVFAVVAVGDHGRWHGMANVGFRPTVNGQDRRFEVHLFDYSGDLYGQELQIKFFTHLRGEQKFSGLDELKAQIARDAQAARDALKDVR